MWLRHRLVWAQDLLLIALVCWLAAIYFIYFCVSSFVMTYQYPM